MHGEDDKSEAVVAEPTSVMSGSVMPVKSDQLKSWLSWVPGPKPQRLHKANPRMAIQIGFSICTCMIFVLSGHNAALMGSVSSVASFQRTVTLDSDSSHDSLLLGIIAACYWVGVASGALIIGWISNLIGRRKAIFCASLLAMVIIPIFTALQNFTWALVLRILNGVATGALDASTLTWSMETANHESRGRVIGLELASSAYGASFAYFAVYKMSQEASTTVVWRFPIALQLVMVLIAAISIWFLPESPRWLVSVGLISDARSVLLATKGVEATDENSEEFRDVACTISAIQHNLDSERIFHASTGYLAMLFRRDTFSTARRTWTALFIQFANQFMIGGGLISSYGIKIFETGGWPASTSSLLTGLVMISAGTGGLAGALLIADRAKRRHVFVFGAGIQVIFLMFLGMSGHFVANYKRSNPVLATKFSIAVIVLQFGYSISYGLGWLWCGFTYPSEIFPAKARAAGNAISVLGFAIGSFTCNIAGSYIYSALGYISFFLVGGMSCVVMIIAWFCIPETSDKTLEDVDTLFGNFVDK